MQPDGCPLGFIWPGQLRRCQEGMFPDLAPPQCEFIDNDESGLSEYSSLELVEFDQSYTFICYL